VLWAISIPFQWLPAQITKWFIITKCHLITCLTWAAKTRKRANRRRQSGLCLQQPNEKCPRRIRFRCLPDLAKRQRKSLSHRIQGGFLHIKKRCYKSYRISIRDLSNKSSQCYLMKYCSKHKSSISSALLKIIVSRRP
jgi:hypothetical protein